jgi:hypothetical protein
MDRLVLEKLAAGQKIPVFMESGGAHGTENEDSRIL